MELSQVEKQEILSFLKNQVLEAKENHEKIGDFYSYLKESKLESQTVLNFLKEHEVANPITPYYSFVTMGKIRGLSARQLALEFLKIIQKENSKLIYLSGIFRRYTGNRYKRISDQKFESILIDFLSQSWLLMQGRTSSLLADVVIHLKSLCYIDSIGERPFWMSSKDINKYFIPLKNGIFDVQKYLDNKDPLVNHSTDFICEYCLPFSYLPSATSIFWDSFLKSTFEEDIEKIEFLQEWFGYCLIPDTRQEKFLLMYGEGANGKSVVSNVLMKLIGMENVSTIGLDTFSQQKSFLLATTIGKLINVSTDLNEVKKAAEGLLKKFISGEYITIEEKYKPAIQIKPFARLTFSTNVLPRFSDRSNGIERRLILLTFNKQFLNEKDQNKNFADAEWWRENNDLEGIFNWALEGLKRLSNRGHFKLSDSMKLDKSKYLEESNPTLTFIKSHFELSSGNSVAAIVAYKNYSNWMKANGYKSPLSQSNFSRELKKAFPVITQSKSMKVVTTSEEKSRSRSWEGITFICDD